jgi:hypothetical protein
LAFTGIVLVSCSIDERQLEPKPGAAGTSGVSNSLDAGGEGSVAGGESGGGAAGAPTSDGLVEGCADLDTDGVADCEVTLVKNPSFTDGVDGWLPLEGTALTWAEKNALSDLPSGSALIQGAPHSRATQCLPLHGQRLVIAYASAFVESDIEEAGHALLAVSFFDTAGCEGESRGFFETPASGVVGTWSTIHAGSLSHPETRSISVTLVGVIGNAESKFYFDNVVLEARSD